MNLDDLARSYATAFKTLKAEWYYAEPRGRAAAEFLEAGAAAREGLQQISAAEIVELLERRSFWINLYNGAVVDRAIALGVDRTVREIEGFFRERWFRLAGEELSLDDIEHGFLRANRILRWYWFDFGRRRGVEEMLRRYRTGGLDEGSWKFAWKSYDWKL